MANCEKGIKNLLIVGRTVSGKSTLCNVLSNTDNFEESEYTAKKTETFQTEIFESNETKYCVVEIGLIEKKVLYDKIGDVIYLMPEGISQVLFVVDERFTAEEIGMLELFEAMFDSGIGEYTTIVRTKFENFKNEELYEKDREDLCKVSETFAKICRRIVYVDNPPIKILVNDHEDEETIKINKKRRDLSRNILLKHLEKVCQEKYYKLKSWDELHSKIASYIESIESIGSKKNSPLVKEIERNLELEVPALKLIFDTKADIKS
ncbi:hypothetical protein C1645_508610 [Glomus cerebriforme]|uniref:AIG1-type G domain-containing protein n=1 Tax=Glomus cerebriforme TaxID=658196 RepID=A0A397SEF0_9GLOM|nr:hypothetical protein C1645_508610 [Glomus cerebriforme]